MQKKQNKKSSLLLNYFKPSIYVKDINKINLDSLQKHGIKVFVCDLDNTLIPFYRRIPTFENIKFINKVKSKGMEFVIVSNNIKKRFERYAKKAGVEHYYSNARKPLLKSIRMIKRKFNVKSNEIIIVGDQLITDIFMANRAHIESILVVPITSFTESKRLTRFLERFIYNKLTQENILSESFFEEGEYNEEYDIL